MQVYGDSGFELDIAWCASELLRQLPVQRDLSALRAALIACGQLEQLVHDSERCSPRVCRDASEATDHAAAALYAVWARHLPLGPRPSWQPKEETERMRSAIARVAASARGGSKLRVPEGFAFYALYPERYCMATASYLQRHSETDRLTHVIGLRSIGTALSAAVAVALRAANVPHCRYTLRPSGHPFARQVSLPTPLARGDRALVVDEGPGLSGSSFYAVARALDEARVPSARQAYFCAHPHPPGAQASGKIREFWQQCDRYVASEAGAPFSASGSLEQTLAAEVERVFGGALVSIEQIFGGAWRSHAYRSEAEWPAVYSAFERPKYLARLSDGRRVLLKYYGQVALPDLDRHRFLWSDVAAAQCVSAGHAPVLRAHGYVGRAWLDGRALTLADKSTQRVRALGVYLASRAWQRKHGIRGNAEGYYGCSGRLSPQEWIELRDGEVVKLPDTLQGYDHTSVDSEPLGWDLAGAIVEWDLSAAEAELLLAVFRAGSGIDVRVSELPPHVSRYRRHHAAKAAFCAGQASGDDAQRLWAEVERYSSREAAQ